MDVATTAEAGPARVKEQRWPAPARIAFRFCFVYFGLYCVLTQIILSVLIIPKVDWQDPATLPPLRAVVFWAGAHIFGLKTPLVYSGSGSGDKYYDWVLVFCMFVFAVVAAVAWSVV